MIRAVRLYTTCEVRVDSKAPSVGSDVLPLPWDVLPLPWDVLQRIFVLKMLQIPYGDLCD
jgi:hypothetical protein